MKFLVWISDNLDEFASGVEPYDNMCAIHNVDIENLAILMELVKAGVIAIAIQKEGDEQ
jgi:poly(A) polymerase Pap1